jgi:hypothetical protein
MFGADSVGTKPDRHSGSSHDYFARTVPYVHHHLVSLLRLLNSNAVHLLLKLDRHF